MKYRLRAFHYGLVPNSMYMAGMWAVRFETYNITLDVTVNYFKDDILYVPLREWAEENASNKWLIDQPLRSVYFDNEQDATMMYLTFR